MPWTYIPKKKDEHRCGVPFGWFKPLGSEWQCTQCWTVYVKVADMEGYYMEKKRD